MEQQPAKFRKKPVIIEAMQFDGTNASATEIRKWVTENKGLMSASGIAHGVLYIATLEGEMKISEGDWVIRGVAGEFYPCKPDIFTATYEPVE